MSLSSAMSRGPLHWSQQRMRSVLAVGLIAASALTIASTGSAWATTTTDTGTAGSAHPWQVVAFDQPKAASVTVALTWASAATNLQLGVRPKGGAWLAWSAKASGTSEELTLDLSAGAYEVGIPSKSGPDTTYTLAVDHGDTVAAPPPSPDPTPVPSPSSDPVPGAVRAADHRMYYEIESKSHDWTLSQAVAQAKAFDVIIAVPQAYSPAEVAAMRKANPDLLIVGYTNGTLAQNNQKDFYPNAWYVKDANGNKIKNDWNLWMMDPGNAGWVKNRADQCKSLVAKTTYNACYLDNMGYGFIKYNPLSGKPINPRTGKQWTYAEWQAATNAEAQSVRAAVGVPVVSNGLVDGSVYYGNPSSKGLLVASDAAVSEVFIRASRDSVNWTPSTAAWKQDLSMVADAAAAGRPIFVTTKVWVPATSAQLTRWRNLAQATFLLGTDGTKSAIHFSTARYESPELNGGQIAKVGTPTQPFQVTTRGVYLRYFTNGVVVVNPTQETQPVGFGGRAYVDESGKVRKSMSLPPMTGAILVK